MLAAAIKDEKLKLELLGHLSGELPNNIIDFLKVKSERLIKDEINPREIS